MAPDLHPPARPATPPRCPPPPAPWIAVTRGPLDTEALSDLASSSLLLGDTRFDVLLMDVSCTARYAAAGWLEPLGNAFDGHHWRLPLSGDTALLYWRTDLLPRPPRDLRELAGMARELQGQGACVGAMCRKGANTRA